MKYKKIILISILTIGFVIRLSTLVQLSSTALFNPVCMDKHDQKTFHLWAQSILKHPFYVDGDAFYMAPLYPYFLALIYAISGGSVFFAGIVQALLDVFAIYLIYLLGKKIKDETTGLIAAGLYAFYQTIVLYSVAILSDGLITFLNICFIFSLYTALEKKRWSFWILSGIILGLAALAKPTILAFIPFVIVGFFIWPETRISPLKTKKKLSHILAVTLVGAIACIIVILPVTIRNYAVSGKFVPICTNGPVNWQIGNSTDSVGLFCYPQGELLSVTDPNFWKLLLRKLLLFFSSYEWPQNLSVYVAREIIPALNFAFVKFGLIVFPGIIGLILAAKNRKNFLFIAFTIVQILWVVMFFITERYRLPAVSCLAVCAGFLITEVIFELKSKKIVKPLSMLAFAGILTYFFNWTPAQTIVEMQYKIFAKLSKTNIIYYLQNKNAHLAEKIAMDYLKLLPDDPDSHFFLACVMFNKGNIKQAKDQLVLTLQINPQHELAKKFLQEIRKKYSSVLPQQTLIFENKVQHTAREDEG